MKIEEALYFIKVTFKDQTTLDTLTKLALKEKRTKHFITIKNKSSTHYTKSELEFYYYHSIYETFQPEIALTQSKNPAHYRHLHETIHTINYLQNIIESYLPSETYKVETVYNYIMTGKLQIISNYIFHSTDIESWSMIPYSAIIFEHLPQLPLYICDNCHILTCYGTSIDYDHHLCSVCNNTSNDQRIKDAQIAYKLLTT
ncbi:MAG: hypothetical protein WCX82_03480 [archaeon]|jgi:hypothetical protein